MKKAFCNLILLVTLINLAAAQSSDTVRLRIWYNYHTVTDTLNHKGFDEKMRLDIGTNTSKYYSENRYLSDSIMLAMEKSGMDMQEIINKRFSLPKYSVTEVVFKNVPHLNKISFYNSILISKYLYYEAMPIAQWEIHTETRKILDYTVQKATTQYAGRNYIAWFAPDIPISEGPWKFSGLPGLILEVADSQNYFSFTAIGIAKMSKNEQTVIQTKELYNKNNLYVVDKARYMKQFKKFKSNPYAILEGMGIKRVNSDGQPVATQRKPPAYNLMEKY